MVKKIEISHRTVVFTVLFLIFLWFLHYIKDIILVFFVSLLLMAILNPSVTRLSKKRIPRKLAVLLVYILMLAILSGSIALLIPPLVEQTSNFAISLPAYLTNIRIPSQISDRIVGDLVTQLGSIPAQILKFSFSLFSNVLAIFTILIFTFYLLLAREKLDEAAGVLFGADNKETALKVLATLEKKLGHWARGELTLMFIVGLLTFLGLTILGIPYALPLALLSGIFEVVPGIGPVISAVPGVIIGFGLSPVIGLATTALYFLIQQVENYVFVPKIMQSSVGVNPIVTLLSLAIGFRLIGVTGAIVAVPVFLTLQTLTTFYFSRKKD